MNTDSSNKSNGHGNGKDFSHGLTRMNTDSSNNYTVMGMLLLDAKHGNYGHCWIYQEAAAVCARPGLRGYVPAHGTSAVSHVYWGLEGRKARNTGQ